MLHSGELLGVENREVPHNQRVLVEGWRIKAIGTDVAVPASASTALVG